jgi:hypothetical protein
MDWGQNWLLNWLLHRLLNCLWLADRSVKSEAQIKGIRILLYRLLNISLLDRLLNDRLLNDRLLDLWNRLSAKNIIVHDVFIALRFIVGCGGLLFGRGFGSRLDKFFSNSFEGFLVLNYHLFLLFLGILIEVLSDGGSSGFFCHVNGGCLIFVLIKSGLSGAIISVNTQPPIVVDTGTAEASRLVRLIVDTAIFRATNTANTFFSAKSAIIATTHNAAHAFSNGFGLDSLFFQEFLIA